jgi:PTS system nitrogen regulatory IIA component
MPNDQSPRFLVSKSLSPESINLKMASRQRDEALAELVDLIPELAERPEAKKTLLQALHDREQLHSTGIGDEVALPHSRNGLVGLVDRAVIAFGRHDSGVPFGSIDGKPARLFFLLVAPSVTHHLSLLARISRMVRDPRMRKNLLAADNPKRVIELIHEAEADL